MSGRTALLIMDAQLGIVERLGEDQAHLRQMAVAIEAARAAGILVVYVRVAFRPGLPEVSSKNKIFSNIAQATHSRYLEEDASSQIHPAVAPREGDVVVTKRRVSAFRGKRLGPGSPRR